MNERQALTIRFPIELVAKAKEFKDAEQSVNDFVVQAVEREIRMRQGLRAHANIVRVSAEIRARTGVQPDSTPLIRAMREGQERDA